MVLLLKQFKQLKGFIYQGDIAGAGAGKRRIKDGLVSTQIAKLLT